ncbi:hypothetical protein PFMALIP_06043 [Plasmodium falciparum MaliPS096_E11]|uniref:Uncharacterized protein n=1 Tax=Plasmodium falciparum MaliPS096_E11 TaxID=1036727 RepID=A0A024WG70_PLAFA|nr:hypothetical protein PFMALIP_06043 [Plasmodium falciparum MaliPS096_E11]
MLKDSIHWKKKLQRCLQNGTKTCGNEKCEKSCKCYESWVQQKGKEWKPIKEHFRNQEHFKNKAENSASKMLGDAMDSPDFVLDGVLRLEFLKDESTEDTQNSLDSEEIQHLRQMLEQAGVGGGGFGGFGIGVASAKEQNTLMDKLIDYEEQEAKKCVEKNPEKCPEDIAGGAGGRAIINPRPAAIPDDEDEGEEEEEEEEEEEASEEVQVDGETQEEAEETVADTTQQEVEKTKVEVDKVKPCKIVEELFTSDDTALQDACKQKYQYGKERFPNWKCIPSGEKSGKSDGSICVPPRRRKLYVTPLTRLAGGNTGSGDSTGASSNTTLNAASSTSSLTDATQLLRQAFIESAAIETFFFMA